MKTTVHHKPSHQTGKLQPKMLALIAAIAIALGGAGWWMSQSGKPAASSAASAPAKTDNGASAAKPALTVSTTQPIIASLAINIAANGNVAAWQEASVGAEASGLRLTQVLVNVGDAV